MALTHEHITALQAVLAAAFSDTPLAFACTTGPLCAVGKIPPRKPCPFPCLDVDLGFVFSSSKVDSYLKAEAKEHGSPWGSIHSNSSGLKRTSSSQCLASVPRDREPPQTFCPSPRPVGHVETRGAALHTLPITTQPSIPSFLFPSFIPFAFFLPHPAPPCLLVPVQGKLLCSRGFLESRTLWSFGRRNEKGHSAGHWRSCRCRSPSRATSTSWLDCAWLSSQTCWP